ncbi:glycosyltransferase [Sphingomonas populi]|uniref:Glycosyltransferase n=1 Tax=Sphingomonas populi TaxID=2484750 RepID=A0A4Q6XT59_9SPHN|nr:acyltransferase family protein [Sphingomonas populi]RZF60742.1 glycosyltransferase [Sphingomonas populi]
MNASTAEKEHPTILSAAQERGRKTLDSVQYLRGVAAMLVVLYHVFPQLERMGLAYEGPQALSAGVDIFFVISGFVMVYSTARHPMRGGFAFLRDRIARVVPLYWLLTLVMILLLVFVPAAAQTSRFDMLHAVASFLFFPWMHPVQHQYWPVLVPGWTLNYEMFFYVVFAVALIISRRRRTMVVVLSCTSLAVLSLVPVFFNVSGIFDFYTRSLILEFGYGMLLGELFLRTRGKTSNGWWAVILIGIMGLAVSPMMMHVASQGIAAGIPALLIVLGALYIPLDLKGSGERIARKIGDASYSIYLSHYILMSALGQLWRKILPGGPISWIGFAVFATMTCAVFGIVVHYLLEKPLSNAAARWLGGAKGQASATRPIAYVVAPSGQAGGGMGRVKDYILSFDEDGSSQLEFRPLITRDNRGFAASLWLTGQAVMSIWRARLSGELGLVHINLGDKASAIRKGLVALLARGSGALVVVHLHAVELDADWRMSGKIMRWAIGLPFRAASTNIVLGDIWRNWLINDLGVKPERIDVLANGVPVPAYERRDHLAPRSAVHLLFLGNLLERKGVSDLIAALAGLPADLPAWRLSFAGGGDLVRYTNAVKVAGISDKVAFLGWVDQNGAQKLLAEADVMVLPSYHEGLPLVILEALGAGTPVIATSVGAIPQFVEAERDALIIAPGARTELSAALARLIGDASLRQKIGDQARATYERNFSLAVFRTNLLAIYKTRLQIPKE